MNIYLPSAAFFCLALGSCSYPEKENCNQADPHPVAPMVTHIPDSTVKMESPVLQQAPAKPDTVVVIKTIPSNYKDPHDFGMEVLNAFRTNDPGKLNKFLLTNKKDIAYLKGFAQLEDEDDREDFLSEIDSLVLLQKELVTTGFYECQKEAKEMDVDWNTISLIKVIYDIDNDDGFAYGDFEIEFMDGQMTFTLSFAAVQAKTTWVLADDWELEHDP